MTWWGWILLALAGLWILWGWGRDRYRRGYADGIEGDKPCRWL